MQAGSGGRVDSQAPLIHAGVLRRSESAPLLELLLVGFAARKALLENVERNLHKGNENIHCRSGAGGNFRTPVRFGSLADIRACRSGCPLYP